jgi:hypothetical protein
LALQLSKRTRWSGDWLLRVKTQEMETLFLRIFPTYPAYRRLMSLASFVFEIPRVTDVDPIPMDIFS